MEIKKEALIERRLKLLKKFYGGKRQSYMHNFNVNNGICKRCKVFIVDELEFDKKINAYTVKKNGQVCPVIGKEELHELEGYEKTIFGI